MTASGNARVFLLHGFAENSAYWSAVHRSLAPHYTCVVPDLPGFGKTPAQPMRNMEDYARYIHAAYVEPHEHIILLGHSMGGYITMAFASLFPQQVLAAGLLHSHVFADSDEQKNIRERSIAFIEKNGTEIYLRDFAKKLFAEETASDIVQRHVINILDTPAEGLTTALAAMMHRKDSSDILSNLDIPYFFLFGRKDALMPVDRLLAQTEPVKKKTVHILEHSAHMGALEEPEKTTAFIADFLTDLVKRDR